MSTDLIVNSTQKGDRIALLKDKSLLEYHFESVDNKFNVGDIFLGTVKRIMPGLNAAFVDIGYEKDAFLHYHDLGQNFKTYTKFLKVLQSSEKASVTLSNLKFESEIEKTGKITQVIKGGQKILVQVTKEPISSKGPRISCNVSLSGRYVVLVPFTNSVNVSRKISTREEKYRLKDIITSIKPKNFGVIVRTAAEGQKLEDLDQDLRNLLKAWYDGIGRLYEANPRDKVIGEMNRTSGLLRDMLNESFDSIQVDSEELFNDIKSYVQVIAPEKANIVKHFNSKKKIFEHFDVEKQLKSSFGKTVSLNNGGYLIIEQTEALMVIDVNSGNVKGNKNESQSDVAFKVNKDTVVEVARQLRLRDIGGIIVVDFIDMKSPEHKKEIYDLMKQEMSADKSKHTILPLTKFGLMQITRQRVRPALTITTSETCPSCNGTGKITASILVSDKVNQAVDYLFVKQNEKSISLALHPFLYSHFTKGLISKQMKWYLKYKKWVTLYRDSSLPITEFKAFSKSGEEIELQQ